jgi:hypothetical protein
MGFSVKLRAAGSCLRDAGWLPLAGGVLAQFAVGRARLLLEAEIAWVCLDPQEPVVSLYPVVPGAGGAFSEDGLMAAVRPSDA